MPLKNRHSYLRIVYHVSIIGLSISLVLSLSDVLFHLLFEGVHLTMEILEQLLDHLIEHLFHTSRRATQIIVFYILLLFGGVMIFLMWKSFMYAWRWFSQLVCDDYLELKMVAMSDWGMLSALHKVIFISFFIALTNLITQFF